MLMYRILYQSIVALTIAAHLVNFPDFEAKSHVTDFTGFELLNLNSTFLCSILNFRLVL